MSSLSASGVEVANPPGYRIESLAKGLRIMTLFTEQRPTWRMSDMVPTVGLPLPTVYRAVMTLTAEGYLEHLPNGEYRPGARVLTLGTAALRALDLVDIATPFLRSLAEATGETVNLGVLTGDQVLYLVRHRNADLVTANIQVGSTLPAVHTSIGKLLIAHLETPELLRRIHGSSSAQKLGPKAKRSVSEMLVELTKVKHDGWAIQDEELAVGLRSVAAGVRDGDGHVIAGANVAVKARDWSRHRIGRELRPLVLETCREISVALGAGRSSRR